MFGLGYNHSSLVIFLNNYMKRNGLQDVVALFKKFKILIKTRPRTMFNMADISFINSGNYL